MYLQRIWTSMRFTGYILITYYKTTLRLLLDNLAKAPTKNIYIQQLFYPSVPQLIKGKQISTAIQKFLHSAIKDAWIIHHTSLCSHSLGVECRRKWQLHLVTLSLAWLECSETKHRQRNCVFGCPALCDFHPPPDIRAAWSPLKSETACRWRHFQRADNSKPPHKWEYWWPPRCWNRIKTTKKISWGGRVLIFNISF